MDDNFFKKVSIMGTVVALVSLMLLVTAYALKRMGRVAGRLGVTLDANSSQTSQLALDPYTVTHVVHGILLFWALSLTGLSPDHRFLAATCIECGWEIIENTQAVIDRYRTETVSLGYNGDSVINSIFDILAMIGGYTVAASIPWQMSIGMFVFLELGMAWLYRDNFLLNVLMLLIPSERIRRWQISQLL